MDSVNDKHPILNQQNDIVVDTHDTKINSIKDEKGKLENEDRNQSQQMELSWARTSGDDDSINSHMLGLQVAKQVAVSPNSINSEHGHASELSSVVCRDRSVLSSSPTNHVTQQSSLSMSSNDNFNHQHHQSNERRIRTTSSLLRMRVISDQPDYRILGNSSEFYETQEFNEEKSVQLPAKSLLESVNQPLSNPFSVKRIAQGFRRGRDEKRENPQSEKINGLKENGNGNSHHDTTKCYNSFINMMKRYTPILIWLPSYKWREWIRGDAIAGLTIAVMTIPQGMAYASLAELPPVYGLYAALVPFYIYAIFGSTPQLVVGMVAVNSLILGSSILPLVDSSLPQSEYLQRYTDLSLSISFFTGIFSIGMGILKLGYAVTFISPSVITGFTTGSALVIALSQLETLFGVKSARSDYAIVQLINIFKVIGNTKWLTFVNGIVSIMILVGLKKVNPKIPGALIVTIFTTLVSFLIHRFSELDSLLPIVGSVPSGLPRLYIPTSVFNANDISAILFPSALLALLGFMQSIAISMKFSEETGETANPSQELVALGLTHVIGSIFQSPDSTGGFSRSAVNKIAGAKTQFSNIIAATVILIALVGMTPLFYFIPKSTLSAIVITAVLPLLDFSKYPLMYKHNASDAIVALSTATLTFFTTIQIGLAVGIAISILVILKRISRPHHCELGEIHTKYGKAWRNINRYPEAIRYPGILVWRFDADLWFGNVRHWESKILSQIKFRIQTTTGIMDGLPSTKNVSLDVEHGSLQSLRFLVLDFGPVNDIDLTGAQAVENLIKNIYSLYGIYVLFAHVKGPVRDTIWKVIGGIPEFHCRSRDTHQSEKDYQQQQQQSVLSHEVQKDDHLHIIRMDVQSEAMSIQQPSNFDFTHDQVNQKLDGNTWPFSKVFPKGKIVREMFFIDVHCAVSYAHQVMTGEI